MEFVARQPDIQIVNGSHTIKDLHSTRELYEKRGALGDDLRISGNASLSAYLSDYHTLAGDISVDGVTTGMSLLSEYDESKSTAPYIALSNLYFVPPLNRALITLPFIIAVIFTYQLLPQKGSRVPSRHDYLKIRIILYCLKLFRIDIKHIGSNFAGCIKLSLNFAKD